MRVRGSGLRDRSGRAAATAVVALLAALAALLYTYPLILHWREAIPFRVAAPPGEPVSDLVPGDHLQLHYYMALFRDMWNGRVPWLSDPYQFSAPEPIPRPNLWLFLPLSVIFALASPLGDAAGYNLAFWSSYVATALAVFGLARRLGVGRVAAAVSAAVGTLLPYRVVHAVAGHPAGAFFFLMPLVFYCLERAWQDRSRASAAAAGLVVALIAANEPHYAYFLAFLLPAWLLSVLWRAAAPAPSPTPRETARSAAILLVSAVGPAVYYAVYSARHWRLPWALETFGLLLAVTWILLWSCWRVTGELRSRPSAAWTAEARSYLPLLVLALYPVQLGLDVPRLGSAILSVTALGLVAAKVALLRRLDWTRLLDVGRWLWPFGVGLAIALGFVFSFKGALGRSVVAGGWSFREVILFSPRLPEFVDRAGGNALYPGGVACLLALVGLAAPPARGIALVGALFTLLALGSRAPQWMPLYRVAFEVVPFFGMIRQPTKFVAVAGLALALVAGFGTEVLRRRLAGRLGAFAAVAVLAAVLVDYRNLVPFGLSALPAENQVYSAVADRARGTNLLELPLWPGDSHYSSLYLYWALRTGVPTVNGYSPFAPRDYVEKVDRPLETMNLGEMSEAQHRLLGELGVRFVTLHRDTFPPKVSAYPYRYSLALLRRNPNLEFVVEDRGAYLFALREGGYRPWEGTAPSPLGVFYEAESLLGASERIAEDAASGGTLVRGAMTDPPFPAMFGPRRTFPRGQYQARFRLRGSGRVDVAASGGRQVLVSAPVASAELSEAVVTFELDEPQSLEFRAWPGWTGPLDVDWVLVEKTDPVAETPSGRIEAEDSPAQVLFDVEDPDASGGAFAIVGGPSGTVVRDGPYRWLHPGRLRVAVRGRGSAFEVQVESADRRRRFGTVTVPPAADWTTVEAEVELPRAEVLCARIASRGSRADADWVEIRRVP